MADKKKLSKKQEKMLLYIEEHIVKMKQPPSIREICEKCGISSTSVADYNLKRLEERGYISRAQHIARGIDVINPIGALLEKPNLLRIGLYGSIAAGEPIPTPDNTQPEEELEIAMEMLPASQRDGLYALRVEGYSMVDALVGDGDIVVIHRHDDTPANGSIVAAWIEPRDEWTLKKFYLKNGTVTLRPCNPNMFSAEDIKERFTFPANEVQVNGTVRLVIRQPDGL